MSNIKYDPEYGIIVNQLQNHTSFESGYVVDNYPYGFKRTEKRYWIETKEKGKNSGQQRLVGVTKNPKTGRWNKPKKSTYCDILIMGLNKFDHVVTEGINAGGYEGVLDLFMGRFELTAVQRKQSDIIRAYARAGEKLTWTVVEEGEPHTGITDREEQNKLINKLANIEYHDIQREKGRKPKESMKIV